MIRQDLDHLVGHNCRGEPYVRHRTNIVCERMFEGEHKVRPYNVVTSTIPFGRNHDQGPIFA